MMLKLSVVYERGAIVVVSALALRRSRLLTKPVTAAELTETGHQCAICHVSCRSLPQCSKESHFLPACFLWTQLKFLSTLGPTDVAPNHSAVGSSQGDWVVGLVQDNIQGPIKLHCNHIFCDECISEWLEREGCALLLHTAC